VGTAGLKRQDGLKSAHKAFIWGMYVAPEARSRGVGRKLVLAVLDEARKMPGLERVTLAVTVGNTPAQSLYRALGFRTYGVEPAALKIGAASIDEELMCLPL
jgi:ribosomal protein S18 acetylase RimI-like enzyme